jgi:hypothetical protein
VNGLGQQKLFTVIKWLGHQKVNVVVCTMGQQACKYSGKLAQQVANYKMPTLNTNSADGQTVISHQVFIVFSPISHHRAIKY